MTKNILDVCCGSKMFYFDKNDKRVLFMDKRQEDFILCDGRKLEIKPDLVADFKKIPFEDSSYKLVVFDPPHISKIGNNSWMAKKYGKLPSNWQDELKQGFDECRRVLKKGGTMIFKWNETEIKTSYVIDLFGKQPVFGHRSGKRSNTHWICYFKS